MEYKDKNDNVVKSGFVVDGIEYASTFEYNYIGEKISERSARSYDEEWNYSYTTKWERTVVTIDNVDYEAVKETDINRDYAISVYDKLGRKIMDLQRNSTDVTTPQAKYEYDALGRVTRVQTLVDAQNQTYTETITSYDNNGNVIETKVKKNAVSDEGGAQYLINRNYYDCMNNLSYSTIVQDDGSEKVVAQYYYDNAGNVLRMYTGLTAPLTITGLDEVDTEQDYAVTKYEYDHRGRLVSKTDALGQTESYTYDQNGNMIGKTDRNGNVTTNIYDGLGRIISADVRKTTTVAGEEKIVDQVTTENTYTLTGALASTSNDTTTISYTYDGFGNKITETESGGVTKTYQYDVHGNMKEYELTVGGEVKSAESYVYDKLDRLTTVSENGNIITSYTYDVNGNRIGKTLANGVTTTYQYNDANWVTNVSNKKDDVVISEYAYTYGLDGTQLQKTEDDGKSVTYTYDSLNRIVNEAYNGAYDNMSISYVYDTYGNRVQKTTSTSESDEVALYTYDKNNRLLTQTVGEQVTEYLYDANGNQVFIDNSDGTYQMYDYTLLNQQAVMYSNGEQINYTYKPDGLRHSVEMDGETKYQYWSGSQLAYEEQGENESVYYLSIETLGRKVNDETPEYYLYNAHGDVVQLTDNTGIVERSYDYDTFGNQLIVNENDDNPLRYNGQYWDEETQTYYLRARQYSPVTGRFTTEDPIADGLNWYVYCSNNPVNFADSTGLDPELDEYVKNNYAGKVTVTIAASCPLENSRIVVDLDAVDVGHTFVRIDYGDGRVIYRGFYPSNSLSTEEILTKADVSGIVVDDASHDWNAAVTYEITSQQADKMLTFIEGYEREYEYNMVTNNCTTFGVQVLAAGGVSAPTRKHKWTLPSNARQMVIDNLPYNKLLNGVIATYLIGGLKGYSPADAVQDFKNAPKYVLKHGNATHIGTNSRKTK